MKDPYSLIADLGLIQLWHRDRHGSDGACGWVFPQLTKAQLEGCKGLGFWEGRERHYLRYPFKTYTADVADREALYRALVIVVARVIRVPMTYSEAAQIAADKLSVGGCEGMDGTFCYLPGYHTNNPEDHKEDRADYFTRLSAGIAREILRKKRHWWQHPRWHFWHWRISSRLLRIRLRA